MDHSPLPENSETSRDNHTRTVPWWVYLLAAVVSYCLLKYFPRNLLGDSTELINFLNFIEKAAPILAIGFLLLAANGLYQNDPPKNSTDTDKENISS